MWQERNDERNLRTTVEGRTVSRSEEEWDERIRRMYERENEVEERDRGVFEVAIGERLGMNLRGKKIWVLKMVKWLNRKKSGKREKGNQADIRAIFQKQRERQQKSLEASEEVVKGVGRGERSEEQSIEERPLRTIESPTIESPGAKAWGSLRRPKKATRKIVRKETGSKKEGNAEEGEHSDKTIESEDMRKKVDQIRRGRQPKFKTDEATAGKEPEESPQTRKMSAKEREGQYSGSPVYGTGGTLCVH
jgi:hypothetical protein